MKLIDKMVRVVVDGVEIEYFIRDVSGRKYLVFYTEFERRNGGADTPDFSDMEKCLKGIAKTAKEGEVMKRG